MTLDVTRLCRGASPQKNLNCYSRFPVATQGLPGIVV
jgi:hypothetical protein